MGKSKDKIRVSFPSASAEKVAGSQVLIQFGKEKEKQQILIECGLIQGESTVLKEYQANMKKFAFKPKELTAVFVCHCHSDHLALTPRLYKEGCKAPLIMPTHNKEIAKAMLLDTAKIFLKDSEYLSRYFKKQYPPIYEEHDVYDTLDHVVEYERGVKHKLNDYIEFQFYNSGHIINSCQLVLWIKYNGSIKKVAITSDLGNTSVPQYYVEDFEPIKSANLIIGEATYCNENRSVTQKIRDKDLEKMKAAIETTCLDQKGSVLIPAFSLQRFQVLLTHLYDIFKDNPDCPKIYACSPLACKISKIFESELLNEEQRNKWKEVESWNKIEFIKDFEVLQGKVLEDKPVVFVASAGMLNAGNSIFIASKLLPRSKNMILFCGYMAQNSIGAKIKSKKTKTIAIDGANIHARCNVMSLNSFSSHMQHNALLDYYSNFCFDKIAIVHAEFQDKVNFCHELQEEISRKNKCGKVICVNKSTEICL